MKSLPIVELRTQEKDGRLMVWDRLRKKWLVLTPEEHVRQCLVAFLVDAKGIPGGLISQEKGLKYDRRSKRYDLVVYDRLGAPVLACECKAPYVPLDRQAALQLAVYNRKLLAPYMLWTNGQRLAYYFLHPEHGLREMDELPPWNELAGE